MRDNNRLIRSTVFYLSLNPGGSAIYKLSPMRKLVQPHSASHCAAQFNFQAFQHTRLWQWTTTARPAPKTAAQTHRFMGKSTLPSPNTCTHVWHDHIWSLHFTHPPPPRTPRPSTQQHPVLTFKDACTEAVKDEHQVLLGNHILLFSFAIYVNTPLAFDSFYSVFISSLVKVDLSRWTAQFLTDRSYIDELLPFSEESLCIFRRSGGSDHCSEAGRQRCSSAKCRSCLPLLPFSLTRCREQESRPRFLTNEDASPMENT